MPISIHFPQGHQIDVLCSSFAGEGSDDPTGCVAVYKHGVAVAYNGNAFAHIPVTIDGEWGSNDNPMLIPMAAVREARSKNRKDDAEIIVKGGDLDVRWAKIGLRDGFKLQTGMKFPPTEGSIEQLQEEKVKFRVLLDAQLLNDCSLALGGQVVLCEFFGPDKPIRVTRSMGTLNPLVPEANLVAIMFAHDPNAKTGESDESEEESKTTKKGK